MRDKYFDSWEFKQIYDLYEKDPITTRNLYENYLIRHPKDYHAYTCYCSTLITLGEFDLAEKILNQALEIYNSDKKFGKFEKNNKIIEEIFCIKAKLSSYKGDYEELYKLCSENINKITEKEINSILFYSKKMTNRLDLNKRDMNSYLFRQIVRYEEEDFRDHIKKHLFEYNENVEEPSTSIFAPNFPIDEVIEEIKKHIPSEKRLFFGFYDNVYFFKYNGCGRSDGKLVDYFRVVCLNGTQNFITMCPVSVSQNLPHIDLNYLVNNEEKGKVKKISQIDKFNQRFKRS